MFLVESEITVEKRGNKGLDWLGLLPGSGRIQLGLACHPPSVDYRRPTRSFFFFLFFLLNGLSSVEADTHHLPASNRHNDYTL